MEWLNGWLPWIAGAGAIAGVLGYLLGLHSVLRILAALVEALAPVLKGGLMVVMAFLGWIWRTLVWPADATRPSLRRGIKDVFDDWVTIVTVAMLFWGLWAVMDYQQDRTVDALARCQTDLVKAKKAQKARPVQSNWPNWLW